MLLLTGLGKEKGKGVLRMNDLLKQLHDTKEGETICMNYEEIKEVLLMERIIEDQEKTIEEQAERIAIMEEGNGFIS